MTTSSAKFVTIMLVPDGTQEQYSWRVRMYVLKLLAVGLGLIIVGIILFFIFYGTMVARTAMTERLKVENDELRRYQGKVRQLEQNLLETRDMVRRLTKLAGIDYQFPDIQSDSLFPKNDENTAILERPYNSDLTIPSGMPIQGFISKEYETADQARYHPGVDIVCPVGTPVLATAEGQVIFAGVDSTYGKMLIIKHNDSVLTLYGHNDSLLVRMGEKVQIGSRIALSGNSGNSTAPHLHYELRVHNKPINPVEN